MAPVLVVDDNASMRRLIVKGLEKHGIDAEGADGGRAALEELCAATARDEPYQAMVLDIMMPNVDGWQVLEAVRSNPLWRDVPVIVVTGCACSPEVAARVSEYDGMLVKKRGDFLEVVSAALGRMLDAA